MADLLGGIGVFWVLFLGALGILWFLLPFAVFGIKRRLDTQIAEQERTNQLLRELIDMNSPLNHLPRNIIDLDN